MNNMDLRDANTSKKIWNLTKIACLNDLLIPATAKGQVVTAPRVDGLMGLVSSMVLAVFLWCGVRGIMGTGGFHGNELPLC